MIASLEHSIAKSSNGNAFEVLTNFSKGVRHEDQEHPKPGIKKAYYSHPDRNKELEMARIALAQKLGYFV